jgi:amino acid permease
MILIFPRQGSEPWFFLGCLLRAHNVYHRHTRRQMVTGSPFSTALINSGSFFLASAMLTCILPSWLSQIAISKAKIAQEKVEGE